ncbi:MAG TPA: Rieske 2Fe-2S domain-containing protein [Candidatus Acidoferrales bacterium]
MPKYARAAKLVDLPPGTIREFQVDGKSVALANVEGSIYAIDNTCLHRGGPLGVGMLEANVVTCPWHGWQYDVKTGQVATNAALKVPTYEVKIEGDSVLVEIET